METTPELPQREFDAGLRNILQALMESARTADLTTTVDDVSFEPAWRVGRPIPNVVSFRIKPEGAPLLLLDFSREQVEDSWDRLDRADVRQRIRAVGEEYKRLRARR